ncbi:hypothetical protein C8R46DRAFT_1216976 [Mycena filopes]|nr:hypothetical protein C8R46DRAFT_1216976 [Mycena filopes]
MSSPTRPDSDGLIAIETSVWSIVLGGEKFWLDEDQLYNVFARTGTSDDDFTVKEGNNLSTGLIVAYSGSKPPHQVEDPTSVVDIKMAKGQPADSTYPSGQLVQGSSTRGFAWEVHGTVQENCFKLRWDTESDIIAVAKFHPEAPLRRVYLSGTVDFWASEQECNGKDKVSLACSLFALAMHPPDLMVSVDHEGWSVTLGHERFRLDIMGIRVLFESESPPNQFEVVSLVEDGATVWKRGPTVAYSAPEPLKDRDPTSVAFLKIEECQPAEPTCLTGTVSDKDFYWKYNDTSRCLNLTWGTNSEVIAVADFDTPASPLGWEKSFLDLLPNVNFWVSQRACNGTDRAFIACCLFALAFHSRRFRAEKRFLAKINTLPVKSELRSEFVFDRIEYSPSKSLTHICFKRSPHLAWDIQRYTRVTYAPPPPDDKLCVHIIRISPFGEWSSVRGTPMRPGPGQFIAWMYPEGAQYHDDMIYVTNIDTSEQTKGRIIVKREGEQVKYIFRKNETVNSHLSVYICESAKIIHDSGTEEDVHDTLSTLCFSRDILPRLAGGGKTEDTMYWRIWNADGPIASLAKVTPDQETKNDISGEYLANAAIDDKERPEIAVGIAVGLLLAFGDDIILYHDTYTVNATAILRFALWAKGNATPHFFAIETDNQRDYWLAHRSSFDERPALFERIHVGATEDVWMCGVDGSGVELRREAGWRYYPGCTDCQRPRSAPAQGGGEICWREEGGGKLTVTDAFDDKSMLLAELYPRMNFPRNRGYLGNIRVEVDMLCDDDVRKLASYVIAGLCIDCDGAVRRMLRGERAPVPEVRSKRRIQYHHSPEDSDHSELDEVC